ncbi:MAG: CBS domain-containing protein [Gammaproteobacteria bacterium]|jgi:CBS domain-containing protein|nr:CBS domain-containing protein [Gammaproteobacteria bacterium]
MEIEQIEIREHLRDHEPFSFLTDEEVEEVARAVAVNYFRAGTDIVRLGDEIRDLHYIRSGSVELFRRRGELYNRLGEGDVFGQLGLLSGRPARFPARALEDTLIYFIPGELFKQLFDSNVAFADYVEVEDRTRLRQAAKQHSGDNPLLTLRTGKLVRHPPVTVTVSTPVEDAARLMTGERVTSVLVLEDEDAGSEPAPATLAGILTDSDLRRRIVAEGLPPSTPVGEVMSGNVASVQRDQFLFEALLVMLRQNVHHLPVLEHRRPVGVLDMADIIHHETQNSLFVVRNIFHCNSQEELEALKPSVAASFIRMVNEDANSHMIGSAMATIGRSFKQRLLELGEEKLGPPPVPYCFLALGSMARDEQFVYTDQDNAMILDDAFDRKAHDEYFRELAQFVSDGLHRAGYVYCSGDIMATNKQWRQPLSAWKRQFTEWIREPNARRLLHSSIFFDLDGVAGVTSMADELKSLIAREASGQQAFLGCLAINANNRTPPLGFFRDFVLEQGGRHENSINLKRRGTAPLVDVIRVHALAAGSQSQNSFRRLEDTVAAGFLTASMAADLRDALEFISMVRARHQARDAERGGDANNNIDPETLSAFERRSLKDAFKVLANAQKFIRFRYRPVRRP